MNVYRSLQEFPTPDQGSVVSVGNFDGVHLGHQAILQAARTQAQTDALPLVALTFDPTPVKVLRPDKAPRLLTTLDVKLKLLAEQGIDHTIVVATTGEFLSLTPAQFAEQILHDRLAARHVFEGQTFSFGQRGAGTMVKLESLAGRFGFQTHLVPSRMAQLEDTSVAVSSTVVRQYLARGCFDEVRTCLGRDHVLTGRIVSGHGHGRELGFPTANLQPADPDLLIPDDGVFAGYARLGPDFQTAWDQRQTYDAAVSIGPCQTFPDGTWQIEAFLLDYHAPQADPLYNQHMILTLVQRTRDQEKFPSPRALTARLQEDCQTIRTLLKKRRSHFS